MISYKAQLFLEANKHSAVEYVSIEGNGCVYRLRDGKVFRLGAEECRQVGVPRFAHLEAADA